MSPSPVTAIAFVCSNAQMDKQAARARRIKLSAPELRHATRNGDTIPDPEPRTIQAILP
jgi:hypothetical protein